MDDSADAALATKPLGLGKPGPDDWLLGQLRLILHRKRYGDCWKKARG